jgi:hypothetical protein
MKKESCTPESQETPEQESRSHPVSFLRKATRLAERGGKKSGKRRAGKRG